MVIVFRASEYQKMVEAKFTSVVSQSVGGQKIIKNGRKKGGWRGHEKKY